MFEEMEADIQDQIASLMYHVSIITPEQQQEAAAKQAAAQQSAAPEAVSEQDKAKMEEIIKKQKSQLQDHLQNAQASHGDEVSAAEVKKKPVTKDGKKVGRNDLCPCGSGKKYKNCCGKNE